MKQQNTMWENLCPIENTRGMGFGRINEILRKIRLFYEQEPITLIPHNEKFIVWDGHGRTTTFMLAGNIYIPSVILENDTDMRRAVRGTKEPFKTLETLRLEYENEIKPELESEGIRKFNDYPVYQELWKRCA